MGRRMTPPVRLATGGLIDRAPAARASRFDGRAYRLRRRHAGLGAARQRRAAGRPLVQISPPARHAVGRRRGAQRAGRTARAARGASRTRAPRWSNCTTGWRRASQNRWPSLRLRSAARSTRLFAPLFVAGFYYKTFMWPACFWEKVYEPLIRRAAGLGRAVAAARPRQLREGLRLLRRAGDRRRPGGPGGGAGGGARGRARDARRGGLAGSAARCSPSDATIDAARPRLGRRRRGRTRGAAERAHAAAHHGIRQSTTAASSARSSGSATTCRCRRASSRASACGASSRSRAVLAAGAIERPLRVRRQRPARA